MYLNNCLAFLFFPNLSGRREPKKPKPVAKPLSPEQAERAFNAMVEQICRKAFLSKQFSPEYGMNLVKRLSAVIPEQTAISYLGKVHRGEIFHFVSNVRNEKFVVLPDGFLGPKERAGIAECMGYNSQGMRVVDFSFFKAWALKNVDFGKMQNPLGG
jgi:hypothetical protein